MTSLTREEVLKIYDRVFHYHFQQPHQINNILTVAAEIQDAYQAKNADQLRDAGGRGMILTDEEIGKLTGCHQVARAIESAVLEKLADQLRDAERLDFLEKCSRDGYDAPIWACWESEADSLRKAIDDEMEESK